MQNRQIGQALGFQTVGQRHDDGEDHGGGADYGRSDQHRLGGGFEGIAGAVVFLQVVLAFLEVGLKSEIFLDLAFDVRNLLDSGKLENRLSVVGDRPVGIDRDGDWAHAQEPECHQAECEDRRRDHQRSPGRT